MDIHQLLDRAGVAYAEHEHPTALTAQEVAQEEHVSGDTVAKPVVVKADNQYVLCVVPASFKIDLGNLARLLQAKQCLLADEIELARLFPDAEVGAEPPFGQPYGLKTVVDRHLANCQTITFSAGTHRRSIRMAYKDYERLEKPLVADLAVHL